MTNTRASDQRCGSVSAANVERKYEVVPQYSQKSDSGKTTRPVELTTYAVVSGTPLSSTGSSTVVFGQDSARQLATQDINRRMAAWVGK